MATDQYAKGAFFLDGQLLVESQSIDVEFDAGNQIITTQQKGFGGISPGSPSTKMTVKSAIPKSGLEVDLYTLSKDRTPVDAVVFAGGTTRTSRGFIMTVSESFGVDNPSTIDFTFEGEPLSYD